MAAFYKQQWFKDALPYAAGALAVAGAVAGVGSQTNWFGYGSGGGGGGGGFDPNSWMMNTSGGAGGGLPTSKPDALPFGSGALPGAMQGGAKSPLMNAAAAAGRGGIFRDIPVVGDVVDYVGRNPAVLIPAAIAAAQMFGSSDDKKQNPAAQTRDEIARTNAFRDNERARWDAIPFTPMAQQPFYSRGANPNAPAALGGERRYFNQGGIVGADEVMRHENGYIQGPGDGMSDDVPAIAHAHDGSSRPVNVADGEYVIAADVVSGLGNGSTDAGVRFLDDLQARIRAMRSGGQQPGAISAADMMPA
jgi:hypothetical protein